MFLWGVDMKPVNKILIGLVYDICYDKQSYKENEIQIIEKSPT